MSADTPSLEEAIAASLLEQCSEAAHNEWLAEKKRRGVSTWPNERGFEQMVPYADCPEDVKEFDRIVVGAIMRVLKAKGLAQLEASRWRPIAEAPPEHELIVLLHECEVSFFEGSHASLEQTGATHWTTLPSLPATASEDT